MSIKKKFSFFCIILFFFVIALSFLAAQIMFQTTTSLSNSFPQAVELIQKESRLNINAQLIRYDDEVLTQSVRNFVFTGDEEWKERYFSFIPKLDRRIEDALRESNEEEKRFFLEIDEANRVLVDLETKAFAAADSKNFSLARDILDSEEYFENKEKYRSGIDRYLSYRGASLDSATAVSTEKINKIQADLREIMKKQIFIISGFVLLFLFGMGFLVYFIVRVFIIPLTLFERASRDIIGGNLNTIVDIRTKDEIGEFARHFNAMTKTLRSALKDTEKKIQERTEQLEKTSRFLVGREIRMKELKKKIRELSLLTKHGDEDNT